MRSLILIILTLGFIASAQAKTCETTCGGQHSDGSQQCWTHCW